MRIILLCLSLILLDGVAFAEEKTEPFRITGKVEAGTGDGAIVPEAGKDNFLAFDVKSKSGKAILKACNIDDICEVAGTAKKGGETLFLRTIKSVLRVKKAGQ